MSQNSLRSSPPWQVLLLVATHLDPKTLAISSCVSKTWHTSMSSNRLWKPLCSTYFPSLSNLAGAGTTVPYCRLYALGHTSAARRHLPPPKPYLTLNNLIFAIDIYLGRSSVVTLAKSGGDLDSDRNGSFKFDIDGFYENLLVFEEFEELRVVWNVVLEGFGGVFSMMDCKGRVGMGGGGWFSEELPSPACCFSGGGSGLAADLRVGLGERGGGKVVVEKVSVGVLSEVSWRYVCVDDVLRYLQHFLMPNS